MQARRLLHPKLTLKFDGGFPAQKTIVVACVICAEGRQVDEAAKLIHEYPKGSNHNICEWLALEFGLQRLQASCWKGESLHILGDSRYVVNFMSYPSPRLAPSKLSRQVQARCLSILRQLECPSWQAQWIPREENWNADRIGRRLYEAHKLKAERQRRMMDAARASMILKPRPRRRK